jgi:hypothetical protein
MLTLEYKDLISEKFNFLVNFFDFEPGDIFVEIFPLKEFKEQCKIEGINISNWCVGVTPKNCRVYVLDKKDFSKREGHTEEEFERVILHELAHMFIRRILWPKQTYIWIQEGICEYLSFGDYPLKIKKFVSLKYLEKKEDWDKHYSYQQSALFFKFLINKFGKDKIPKFIKKIKEKSEEESFKEVFGEELNKAEEEFKAFLENEKITSSRNTL